MMLLMNRINAMLLSYVATTAFGFINAQEVGSKDLFKCRQNCYQKFVHDWHHCMDFEDCKNMCITPPNINSYIPEAFSFLCWNNCDQQLGPFPLKINSALRQGSLVLTDIAWDQAITNASKQCLVTWEVSGGGLMGNLLTDSSTVELSLWPDTVYHVQVTCKHKESGGMRRSFKLIVDTHKLSDSTATGIQSIAIETGMKAMPNIFATEQATSAETESRMRILKDSSKDFLSPYNPNANAAISKKVPATTPKVSTTPSQETNAAKGSSSVLRTKLTSSVTTDESTVLFTQTFMYATVGSLALFFGLILIYVLIKPSSSKHLTSNISAVDKEVLIQRELLPSQTPAVTSKAAPHPTPLTTVTTPDSRTLHV